MYRIDGIYNSGYAHAPALIVNPSGSYPLIYNSTTGILQQTPNDQKVDKASEVEFTSVKTATVKSLTGTDAVLIDSTGGIFAQKGLWSSLGVTIGDLQFRSLSAGAYGITGTGLNDTLSIYSTKGVRIGFANNNFLFEPASATFPNPSFRIPSGASMWTSKIYSVTGQPAITIADNGSVTIPSISTLTVNPSGSYPLIYNSTTAILQQTPNDQKVDKASEVEFKSVDATAYKMNGAAVNFPTQAVNTTSTPTFAGLTTTPVLPSVKAPILTTSTDGASTNSNPNGNGADLDVFDLRIRSGRLFTTAATLQLGKKFSCDKQFNITGNNAATTGETPYVTLRGAVQLQIGTTNFPSAILVADTTGIVTVKDLQATNTLEVTNTSMPMRALGGVNAVQQSITGGNLFANVWQSNPPETGSFPTQQAVATSTGPNFTNGIRVNNIKRPDGTQTFIDMNGTQPSFPLGLTATSVTSSSIYVNDIKYPTGSATLINFNGPRPYFPEGFDAKLYPVDGGSEVTYNAAVNTFGYKPRKPDPAVTHIRFAQNALTSFLDNAYDAQAAVQTWYYQYYLPRYPQRIRQQFGGNRGYPPLIENAQTLIAGGIGYSPNIYFSFEAQTPFESTNFPNTWQDTVKQKFPSLGTYMITWNIGSLYDPRRVLLSINKNFVCSTFNPIDGAGLSNMFPAANDPTALTVVENYTHTLENGTSLTAIVNITSLNDYVTYTMYNYDARTFLSGQGRIALSVVKVGQL